MTENASGSIAPPVLGKLIDGKAFRDAIHVAVAPVVADCWMKPGDHIGILSNGKASPCLPEDCIGIVDPFLREPVEEGQTFWLLMYPNSVSNLRHSWSHQAFKAKTPTRVNMITGEWGLKESGDGN